MRRSLRRTFSRRERPTLTSRSLQSITRPFQKHFRDVFGNARILIFYLSLTLFRLGFFGQSVTGVGGAPRTPLCISGTNNARVMKFTHSDHLRKKKPHTQFSLATLNDDVTVTSYSDFLMFLIIFSLSYVKYQ